MEKNKNLTKEDFCSAQQNDLNEIKQNFKNLERNPGRKFLFFIKL